MKVLVSVFTYNRPNLLKFCSEWFLSTLDDCFDVVFFDDDSDDPLTLRHLCEFEGRGYEVVTVRNLLPRDNYRHRAVRCGLLRQAVVDYFLARDYDYLVFKDDDILLTSSAVLEALADFDFLRSTDWARPGALTLHGLCTHGDYVISNGSVFAALDITGEANVIFSRDSLLSVGNHFSAVKGGFADTQFQALRKLNWQYYDRVWPPHEVQHLGVGPDSSSIHRRERVPAWNTKLYHSVYRRREFDKILSVRNFDSCAFELSACSIGAEKAVQELLGAGL